MLVVSVLQLTYTYALTLSIYIIILQEDTTLKNKSTKFCTITKGYNSLQCLKVTYPFNTARTLTRRWPKLVCQKYVYNRNAIIRRQRENITLQTTCGPTLEETHHTEYVNRRLFMFTCPSGAGSLNDFHYSWYSERVSDSRLIKNGSRILEQQLRAEELPLIFLCQIKNVHTGKNVRFTLKVVERVSTEQRSLLWVVIPALLIIILVPLTYLAYLKFIGEFDIGCNCQNAILEDDVDYMITQIAESSNPQEDKKSPVTKARRSKLALFRRTLRQVSNAVNKISSNISLTATVQASLPITDDQTKIKASKKMRLKRAEFLKQLNWPTLFKRPTRKIKKQSEKDYEDDETHWAVSGK